MTRRKKHLIAMVTFASVFILGSVLMYLNAQGIISMGAAYPPLIPFLGGWAGCMIISVLIHKNKRRKYDVGQKEIR